MPSVRTLLKSELEWANQRYAEIHFLPSRPQDIIAVAEVDGVKAGLGRLVGADDSRGELGGIYVLPEFRGRKIAAAIVSFLLQHSPYRQLFCIPFNHLEAFYRGFGFHPVAADAAVPTAVTGKLDWCSREYPESVTLLLRVAPESRPGSASAEDLERQPEAGQQAEHGEHTPQARL
jgi:GNAT superfamily N-acetyltransferase